MSKNQKTKHHHIAVGLAVYKTGNSPFWYARVWNARNRKYHVRSTKCEVLGEAIDEAYLIRQKRGIESSSAKVHRELTFRHFAKQQMAIQQRAVNNGLRKSRYVSDDVALLERKADGILSQFGDHHVQDITTKSLRVYLDRLNENRQKPLSPDRQNRHLVVIGKILKLAVEEGALATIPQMPRVSMKINPKPSFSPEELGQLLQGLKRMADVEGPADDKPSSAEQLYCLVGFTAHSGIRPVISELYDLQNKNISIQGNGRDKYLSVAVQEGKVKQRTAITLPRATYYYERLLKKCGNHSAEEFVFFPKHHDRKAASVLAQRLFKRVLEDLDLRFDDLGQKRSLYSLRHYYIEQRLDAGVSIYTVSKNIDASVGTIERWYAAFPIPSNKRAQALNAGSQLTRTKKRSASSTTERSTSELEEKILELHDQGKKADEIVAMLNATEINVKLTLVKWDRPTD